MIRAMVLVAGLTALAACETRVEAPEAASLAGPVACVLPDRIERPHLETLRPDEVVADRPIRFHLLAITWMPETCKAGGDGDGDMACGGPNKWGWTLHGLWPNSDGRPYPRYCRPAQEVSSRTIRAELCRTPSVDLVQHEWAAHGTCGWETPEAYFAQSAALYDAIKMPDPETLAPNGDRPTAGQLRVAIHAANPSVPENGVYVAVSSGNRLREVRLCHDLTFQPTACPEGLGAPDAVALTVEPTRK